MVKKDKKDENINQTTPATGKAGSSDSQADVQPVQTGQAQQQTAQQPNQQQAGAQQPAGVVSPQVVYYVASPAAPASAPVAPPPAPAAPAPALIRPNLLGWLVTAAVFTLIIAGFIYWVASKDSQIGDMKLENQLNETRRDLVDTNEELDEVKSELGKTKADLDDVTEKLARTREDVKKVSSRVSRNTTNISRIEKTIISEQFEAVDQSSKKTTKGKSGKRRNVEEEINKAMKDIDRKLKEALGN